MARLSDDDETRCSTRSARLFNFGSGSSSTSLRWSWTQNWTVIWQQNQRSATQTCMSVNTSFLAHSEVLHSATSYSCRAQSVMNPACLCLYYLIFMRARFWPISSHKFREIRDPKHPLINFYLANYHYFNVFNEQLLRTYFMRENNWRFLCIISTNKTALQRIHCLTMVSAKSITHVEMGPCQIYVNVASNTLWTTLHVGVFLGQVGLSVVLYARLSWPLTSFLGAH